MQASVSLHELQYSIAQNFDRGNFLCFDAFQLDHQNLTRQSV